MFQFPGFALCGLCIQPQSTWFARLLCATASPLEHARSRSTIASLLERIARMAPPSHTITVHQVGFPIRKSMDQGLFTAPHGLSQCTTSFIASCCQGIHQTPFSRLIRPGKSRDGAEPVHAPSRIGSSTFPCAGLVRPGTDWSVYLTWIVRRLAALPREPTDAPSRGDIGAMTDVCSQRCQNVRNRTIRSTARVLPMIGFRWWSLSGSNRRPPACKAGALPAELRPLSFVGLPPSAA